MAGLATSYLASTPTPLARTWLRPQRCLPSSEVASASLRVAQSIASHHVHAGPAGAAPHLVPITGKPRAAHPPGRLGTRPHADDARLGRHAVATSLALSLTLTLTASLITPMRIESMAGVDYPAHATASGKPTALGGSSLLPLLDADAPSWQASSYCMHLT